MSKPTNLEAELEELRHVIDEAAEPARNDHTNLFVGSTIVIAVLGVGAIIVIFLARPDKDNTALIATVISLLVPVMTGLLAAAVREVHAAVNSRLSQLLQVTAAKARAEGVLAQKLAQQLLDEEEVGKKS